MKEKVSKRYLTYYEENDFAIPQLMKSIRRKNTIVNCAERISFWIKSAAISTISNESDLPTKRIISRYNIPV